MGFSTRYSKLRRTSSTFLVGVLIVGSLMLSALLMLSLASPRAQAASAPQGPDRAFRTPLARSARAVASSGLSARKLGKGLTGVLRGFKGSVGAWVADLGSGKLIYARNGNRTFPIASNTKIFTTATALSRLGPSRRLTTTVWSLGQVADGRASGGLVIVGDGDPTLGGRGIAKLAKRIAAAGVSRVAGPILYDASNFDQRIGVPQSGVTGGPYLGSLSGLSYEWGWGSSGPIANPAAVAASELARQLRKRDVVITGKVKRASSDTPRSVQVAALESPDLAAIAKATNTPSDNFLAEMVLKMIPDQLGRTGTTAAGVKIVERFAATHDSRVRMENGSGLSRKNRATPEAMGRFLISMANQPAETASAFRDSLAIAGRTGTLAFRMQGSAAEGRCSGKTGTLNGVSALSGFCRSGSGDAAVFSLLFGGSVDTDSAHVAQDRAAALIARYAR